MHDEQQRLVPASSADELPFSSSSARGNDATKPVLSRFDRFRRRLVQDLDAAETHWSILGLAGLDFFFTISELSYAFLRDSSCECTNSCKEPPLLEMIGLLSTFITTAFVVEIPLDLVAFGPAHYLTAKHHWLHLFDAIVVIVAFVLEVVLQGPMSTVASLVIILRLWRIMKLLSSLEVSLNEFEEEKAGPELPERIRWREERRKLRGEVDRLRKRLVRSGINERRC
ncbi:hypothetical protein JCM8547_003786 [Rhodosporidiobolus lusitaniae]